MNIKLNESEFNKLMLYKHSEYVFGSHLYGLENKNSDKDIMVIFNTPESWNDYLKFYNIHHQFQYKKDNIDYVFTSVEQFWKNLSSGDSTINSDLVLFSKEFNYSDEIKINSCYTYKVIKAYLGFIKRDLKKPQETNKKNHILRGFYIVSKLLNKELPNIDELKEYIFNNHYTSIDELIDLEKLYRFNLNDLLHKKLINHYNVPLTDDLLLNKLLDSLNIIEFKYD